MTKTKQDNMTDHIGAVYIKNKIELLWLIRLGVVTNENKQDNGVTKCIGTTYIENNTRLSRLIGSGTDYDDNQIGQLHG